MPLRGDAYQREWEQGLQVSVDGAPTTFCFHASCAPVVAEANRSLRGALAGGQWSVALPGGGVLRSGDVLQRDGTVLAREAVIRSGLGGSLAPPGEKLVLETLRAAAERFKPELFDFFRWPMAQILEDSPLLVAERDPEDQFRTWLKLWPACSTV